MMHGCLRGLGLGMVLSDSDGEYFGIALFRGKGWTGLAFRMGNDGLAWHGMEDNIVSRELGTLAWVYDVGSLLVWPRKHGSLVRHSYGFFEMRARLICLLSFCFWSILGLVALINGMGMIYNYEARLVCLVRILFEELGGSVERCMLHVFVIGEARGQ